MAPQNGRSASVPPLRAIPAPTHKTPDELSSLDRIITPGLARTLVDRFADSLGEEWFDEPDRDILNRLLQAWRIREAERLREPEPLKSLTADDVLELFEDSPYDTSMLNMDVPDSVQLDELPFTSPEWGRLAVELIDEDEEQWSGIIANLDAMTVYTPHVETPDFSVSSSRLVQ